MSTATAARPPATRPTAPANTPQAQAERLMAEYIEADNDIEAKRSAIQLLERVKTVRKAQLQQWAEENGSLFTGKMLKIVGGSIGYKAGTKSVAFPDPEKAPADILEKYLKIVREEAPAAIDEKVNASKVIKAWDLLPALKKRLVKLGLSISQADIFIVSPSRQTTHE